MRSDFSLNVKNSGGKGKTNVTAGNLFGEKEVKTRWNFDFAFFRVPDDGPTVDPDYLPAAAEFLDIHVVEGTEAAALIVITPSKSNMTRD